MQLASPPESARSCCVQLLGARQTWAVLSHLSLDHFRFSSAFSRWIEVGIQCMDRFTAMRKIILFNAGERRETALPPKLFDTVLVPMVITGRHEGIGKCLLMELGVMQSNHALLNSLE